MRISETSRLLTVAAGVLATAGMAGAANCALRNPDRQIFQIFPDATNHRTVVARVDDDMKRRIDQLLGSPLTRTDLGKHTLYVVLKRDIPIGFVHARTESGRRGSVELVWALDLDLTIRDFRVQRSREQHTDLVETDAFRETMTGRDLAGLRTLLTVGNDDVDLSTLGVPQNARSIAHCVVLCGIKTRIITELAFRETLTRDRRDGFVHHYFPRTEQVQRLTEPYPEAAVADVAALVGSTPDQCDRKSFTIFRALGPQGALEGVLVLTTWSRHRARPETWWALSADGTILDALFVGELDEETRRQAAALKGRDLVTLAGEPAGGAITPARCALEVLAVVATHGIGAPADR